MGPQKRLMKDRTAEGGREREEQRRRGTGEQTIFGDLQVLITRDIPEFIQHWRLYSKRILQRGIPMEIFNMET
jgi:hypothetical protein